MQQYLAVVGYLAGQRAGELLGRSLEYVVDSPAGAAEAVEKGAGTLENVYAFDVLQRQIGRPAAQGQAVELLPGIKVG